MYPTRRTLKLAALFLLAFAAATLYLTTNTGNVVTSETLFFHKRQDTLTEDGSCNLFSGKWVYDNVSYPLYKEGDCALIGEEFSCQKYGRKNLKYQNWRWQPHHCHLPKFNGTALLEKLRNKKLLFVGDSLNRNQWRSLLCLIEPYLPPSTNKTVGMESNSFFLHVKDYNATIAFYWAPLLVESNADHILEHRIKHRIVRIESIEKHGRHWINADILIFDSYVWWKTCALTILWGSFDSNDAIYLKVDLTLHDQLRSIYEMALNTWSDWLEFHIDPNKTKIFFMSISPFAQGYGKTFLGTNGECYNIVNPIYDTRKVIDSLRVYMEVVESKIEKLEERGVKVEYLNITELSSSREDAHPSIYMEIWKSIALESRDPNKLADCLHWCLPGVPDVWNQILYAYILNT